MMSRQEKIAWPAMVGAAAGAVTLITTLLLRPTAEAAVKPTAEQVQALDKRVVAIETAQKALESRLDDIKADTRCLRNMHMNPPQPCSDR
jgi:membrane-bound lytic murein transglycosylase B